MRVTIFKDEIGHFEVEKVGSIHNLHLELYMWGAKIYTLLLERFKYVLGVLRNKGVEEVYCTIPNDKKLIKFEQMFGFKIASNNGNYIIMKRNTSWA